MLPKLSECGSSLPTHWLSEILLETPRRAERIYWSVITQWSPSASIWAVNMSGCFTMPQHATKMSVSNLVTSLAMGKDFKGECAVLSFVLSREKRWIFIWTRINLSFFTSPSAYNPCCAPFPRWTSLIQQLFTVPDKETLGSSPARSLWTQTYFRLGNTSAFAG